VKISARTQNTQSHIESRWAWHSDVVRWNHPLK